MLKPMNVIQTNVKMEPPVSMVPVSTLAHAQVTLQEPTVKQDSTNVSPLIHA